MPLKILSGKLVGGEEFDELMQQLYVTGYGEPAPPNL